MKKKILAAALTVGLTGWAIYAIRSAFRMSATSASKEDSSSGPNEKRKKSRSGD